MRFLTLLLFLSFTLPMTGQDTTDYVLFRPGVQYIFTDSLVQANPFNTGSLATDSPLIGMRIGYDAGPRQRAYVSRTAYHTLDHFYDCSYLLPSFAGTEIEERGGTTTLYFGDTASMVLYPALPPGSSWMATPHVRAEVLSVAEGTVLDGLTDSLKTIRLLDDRTTPATVRNLVVSKHYGLVRGFYFYDLAGRRSPLQLSGLSSPRMGIQNPTLEEVVDVPVGTRLSIRKTDTYYPTQNSIYYGTELIAATVSGVTMNARSNSFRINYRADILSYRRYEGSSTNRDSMLLRNRTGYLDIKVDDAILTEDGRPTQPGQIITNRYSSDINMIMLAEDRVGYGKFASEPLWRDSEDTTCYQPPTDAFPSYRYYNFLGGQYGRVVTQGGPSGFELLGASNDSLSFGTLYDFSDVIISTRNPANQVNFTVYPNPAGSSLHLSLPASAPPYGARLLDLNGREVKRWATVTPHHPLDVSPLPRGVYVLTLTEQGRPVGRRRLILQ